MKIKAVDVQSGDTLIKEDYKALVLNVRRLMVCGTPQIVHIVLNNTEDAYPGGLLYDVEDMVEITEESVNFAKLN
jgi:hypothetical protein